MTKRESQICDFTLAGLFKFHTISMSRQKFGRLTQTVLMGMIPNRCLICPENLMHESAKQEHRSARPVKAVRLPAQTGELSLLNCQKVPLGWAFTTIRRKLIWSNHTKVYRINHRFRWIRISPPRGYHPLHPNGLPLGDLISRNTPFE